MGRLRTEVLWELRQRDTYTPGTSATGYLGRNSSVISEEKKSKNAVD